MTHARSFASLRMTSGNLKESGISAEFRASVDGSIASGRAMVLAPKRPEDAPKSADQRTRELFFKGDFLFVICASSASFPAVSVFRSVDCCAACD